MSFLNIFIATLLTLTFSLNINAATSLNIQSTSPTAIQKVEGGPRTVIQAMTDITVQQPTATNLYITIVDTDDNTVLETETQKVSTLISVAGLEKGNYIVETIDDNGDYQEFAITVD
jgi:hypothetical protein